MFCMNCGIEIVNGTKFCPSCGTTVTTEKVTTWPVKTSKGTIQNMEINCHEMIGSLERLLQPLEKMGKIYEKVERQEKFIKTTEKCVNSKQFIWIPALITGVVSYSLLGFLVEYVPSIILVIFAFVGIAAGIGTIVHVSKKSSLESINLYYSPNESVSA